MKNLTTVMNKNRSKNDINPSRIDLLLGELQICHDEIGRSLGKLMKLTVLSGNKISSSQSQNDKYSFQASIYQNNSTRLKQSAHLQAVIKHQRYIQLIIQRDRSNPYCHASTDSN